MKVIELIQELKKADPEQEVYIHDADTGWLLRLKIGMLTHTFSWVKKPDNVFVVGCDYHEEGQIEL